MTFFLLQTVIQILNRLLKKGLLKSEHSREQTVFFKFHIEYVSYNTNIPYAICVCKIFRNASLLAKGLNNRKIKSKEKLPTNPNDLVQKFSHDTDETQRILGKCLHCKSHKIIDDMMLLYSSRAESSSKTCSSCSGENIIETKF